VALMGGTITVDSESGRGSTFAFTVQLGRQPQTWEHFVARPPVPFHNLPVLVVDDNATNRHILEEWLHGWQMAPVAVDSAAAAMDALLDGNSRGRPFELVLLDARMPDVDGLVLTTQIRQRAELAGTRIIVLTSGERPGDVARFRELRIDAHLVKPVQQDELLESIHRVMERTDSGKLLSAEFSSEHGPAPIAHSAPLRILVAEDNKFNAQLMEQLLARRGHHIRLASNGREALSLTEEGTFDLLLLDIHMPELDGFQVVEAIRKREEAVGGHLPVIALTARSRDEDRMRCLSAGIDDFLAKPIQAADLWTVIDRIVVTRPPASTSVSSLLDARVLLAACGDDAVILRNICLALQASLPDHLTAIRDALRARDALRLREAAHKFSGMVAAFSTIAGRVASDLEDHAAKENLEEARPLVEKLESMSEELMRTIRGVSIETLRQQAMPPDDSSKKV
jgi:two-component system, sensor histidine kinase and response regulator